MLDEASLYPENPARIGGELLADFLERLPPDPGDGLYGFDHIGRLVALSAIRLGRDIRRIGFRKQHVKWRILYDLIVIVGKGNDTRKREREADVEELFGDTPIPREEMHVAFHFRVCFYQGERVFVGVPDMEHERLPEGIRKFYLLHKGLFLFLFRI